jgi:5-methylcytosine-specific restriction endonuclease McrA
MRKYCLKHGLYEPGNPPVPGGRCPDCQREHNQITSRRRGSSTRRGYDTHWQALARRALTLHPVCSTPGCGATHDLTVDHINPATRGQGELTLADVQVLCRSCNSRKGVAELAACRTGRRNPHAGKAPEQG